MHYFDIKIKKYSYVFLDILKIGQRDRLLKSVSIAPKELT